MTGGHYEIIWPPGSPTLCPVESDTAKSHWREDGSFVVLCSEAEFLEIAELGKAIGLKEMRVDILSIRTTVWLIRSDDGDILLVRPDRCTVKEVVRELERDSTWMDKKYFIYPVVNGTFKVNVTLNGFCIPVDRRILNQNGRVVVDPDVPVAQPTRQEVIENDEGF